MGIFSGLKKSIELSGEKIEYILKISDRARRIRFTVYGGGELVVTVPRKFRESDMERFMHQKADWILEKTQKFKKFKKNAPYGNERHNFLIHRRAALALVRRKLAHYNSIYSFDFNKIAIKSQRTCWGSCSKRRNLNFNYKLAFLPEYMVDYVVVHELCHLGEFNHSKNFWDLVARAIPDYLRIRKELKQHSLRAGSW